MSIRSVDLRKQLHYTNLDIRFKGFNEGRPAHGLSFDNVIVQ